MSTATSKVSGDFSTKRFFGVGLGVIVVFIWGAHMAYARAAIVDGFTSYDLAFLRYSIAGPLMLPWLIYKRKSIFQSLNLFRILLLTLLAGPLFMLILSGGYSFAPLAHGVVIQPASITLSGFVLAYVFAAERYTAKQVSGLILLCIGVAVIALGKAGSVQLNWGQSLLGDLMFALAGGMWAVFTLLCKRWSLPPASTTAVVSICSAVLFLPFFSLGSELDQLLQRDRDQLLIQALVQGLMAGVVALLAYAKVVQLLGVARATAFPALVPAAGLLIGIPVTGEIPEPWQCLGLTMTLLGFYVINKRRATS